MQNEKKVSCLTSSCVFSYENYVQFTIFFTNLLCSDNT